MILRTMAVLAGLALSLAGCGGGADRTKAQVRLVNASSGYAQLALRVHDENRQASVSYGDTASYVEVDPGKADTQITQAGSSTALLSFTPGVSAKRHYTVLAYGALGALKQVTLEEEQAAPDNNKTLLRVINGAADAGALDIYLTDASDSLTTAVAVQANAAFGTLGSWITVDSRTWRLRVTGANNKADQRLDVSGLVLGSRQVATLVLSSAAGGVLVNGLLIGQQGSIVRQDIAHARVRAVAGVADSAAVSARLGSVDLISGVGAPAVGNYMLVPAGDQALAVSINSAALPASTQTLAAGADYTLLVHGTPTTPLVNRIDDDNHLPSDASQARIRLVNGVSGLAGSISMTVDGTPVGAGVGAGAASSYEFLAGTATAEINVTSPGVGVLFRDVDRTLLAGATYSVFVLGDSTAPRGLLRKDR